MFSTAENINQRTSINALNTQLVADSFDEGSQDMANTVDYEGMETPSILAAVPDHLSNLDKLKSRRASAMPAFARPNIDRFLLRDSKSYTRGEASTFNATRSVIDTERITQPGRLPQM